jgi:hypothetical protein
LPVFCVLLPLWCIHFRNRDIFVLYRKVSGLKVDFRRLR